MLSTRIWPLSDPDKASPQEVQEIKRNGVSEQYLSCITGLSHRYNLFFVANYSDVHVHLTDFHSSHLLNSSVLTIETPRSPPTALAARRMGWYVPHVRCKFSINHLLVANLGNEEVLLLAREDGALIGYYTRQINTIAKRLKAGTHTSTVNHLRPFILQYTGTSAWGLAVHTRSRKIAVSTNSHRVHVFAPELVEPAEAEMMPPESVPVEYREESICTVVGTLGWNIASIAFCNTGADPTGTWLLAGSIIGFLFWIDVTVGRVFKAVKCRYCRNEYRRIDKCDCSDVYLSPSLVHAIWGIHFIDDDAFHEAKDNEYKASTKWLNFPHDHRDELPAEFWDCLSDKPNMDVTFSTERGSPRRDTRPTTPDWAKSDDLEEIGQFTTVFKYDEFTQYIPDPLHRKRVRPVTPLLHDADPQRGGIQGPRLYSALQQVLDDLDGGDQAEEAPVEFTKPEWMNSVSWNIIQYSGIRNSRTHARMPPTYIPLAINFFPKAPVFEVYPIPPGPEPITSRPPEVPIVFFSIQNVMLLQPDDRGAMIEWDNEQRGSHYSNYFPIVGIDLPLVIENPMRLPLMSMKFSVVIPNLKLFVVGTDVGRVSIFQLTKVKLEADAGPEGTNKTDVSLRRVVKQNSGKDATSKTVYSFFHLCTFPRIVPGAPNDFKKQRPYDIIGLAAGPVPAKGYWNAPAENDEPYPPNADGGVTQYGDRCDSYPPIQKPKDSAVVDGEPVSAFYSPTQTWRVIVTFEDLSHASLYIQTEKGTAADLIDYSKLDIHFTYHASDLMDEHWVRTTND